MATKCSTILHCTAVVLLARFSMITCLAATACTEVHVLPDMYLMKQGYHIVNGNPSLGADPGFVSNIFDLVYNMTTLIDCYVVPEKYEINSAQACSYNSETAEMSTSNSYRETVSADIGISGGPGPEEQAQFTGSGEYKKTESEIVEEGHTWVWQTARCATYQVELVSRSSFYMTQEFDRSVRELPTTYIDEKLRTFVDRFGTHYPVEATMGAKFRYESLFEYCTWTRMEQSGFNIGLGAEASFGRALGHVGVNKEHADQYDGNRTTWEQVNVGPAPTANQDPDSWHAEIKAQPRLISFTLVPLTDLITTEHFPDFGNIDAVRNRLEEFILRLYESHAANNVTYDPSADYAMCGISDGNRPVATLLLILQIVLLFAYL